MKFLSLSLLIILIDVSTICGQRIADENIPDSVIGWWGNNRFDHLKPQTDAAGKKKEAIVNDMVKWMKASYTPVGGLGTSSRYIGAKGYGVNFLVWNVSHDKQWTEPNGNFKPISEENTKFAMAANQLFGAFPIYFMNTGKEFYFTIQPDGYADNESAMERRKVADPRIHPNAYHYITRMNDWCTVYLAPDNKLPWTPVSKGELLQKAEEGLQKVLADKRKEVAAQWPDNKKSQDEAFEYFSTQTVDKYRKKIQELRSKHGKSLNEHAIIRSMQPTMYSFETDPDLFQISGYEKDLNKAYEVYKLDEATMAKLGDAFPQWVSIAFPFENKESGNQLYEMFTALSQNINYDYIYQYFYDPEKVKGVNYTAANADALKKRLDNYRSTTKGKQNAISKKQAALPAGVVLFEDFSQEQSGDKPAAWYSNNNGKAHVVSKVAGENGNWLRLGYANRLTSATLKTLPENFSLEYDIITSEFSGRWGANVTLEMKGSRKASDGTESASYLKTSITAGNQSALEANHDYRGDLKIDLINTPSKMDCNDQGGYFLESQSAFTSTRRKVHVQVLKKGDNLVLLLNGKEVANSSKFKSRYGKPCGDCSIPAGMVYNGFTINSFTQDADTIECYIGNIRVTKM
jgi:hypothetical protein